jgi:hypothetical protein
MSPEPSKKQTKHKAATVRIPEDLHNLFQSLTDARVFNKVVVGLLHMYEQHPEVQEYLVNTSAKDEEAAQRSFKRLMRIINAPMLAENGDDVPTSVPVDNTAPVSELMGMIENMQKQLTDLQNNNSSSDTPTTLTASPAQETTHDLGEANSGQKSNVADVDVDTLLNS